MRSGHLFKYALAVLLWLFAAQAAQAATPLSAPLDLGLLANGGVYAVARQADGKIVIGGAFSLVNGVARNNIARLNADGTLDMAWNANANSDVNALTLDGAGNLYAGGNFTTIGGQARNRIAKLNTTNGNAEAAWNANANSTVRALALDGAGNVYVGGEFSTVDGQARNYIAKLSSANGNADVAWNANANSNVYALALDGAGNLYAGGGFTTIGGQARNYIAKLSSANGNADATWNANANSNVFALALDGAGNLYVGGWFTTIGGQARNRLAILNTTNGDADLAWNPNANNTVIALALDGSGNIYAGGTFTTIDGQARNGIAKLNNTNGNADAAWNPDVGGIASVNALAVDGAVHVYAGGYFASVAGQPHLGIARLDGGTASAAGFSAQAAVPGTVAAIARQSDGKILVGGGFNLLSNGTARNNILRLNADGTLDAGWDANANDWIFSLAVDGSGNIYTGGFFTTIGGQARNYIAKLNSTNGNADAAWNPNANAGANISALAPDGSGNIYVGAVALTSIGGQTRNNIAKLNTTNGDADAAWNPDANGNVLSLALDGSGNIYAGGTFTTIGGLARNRLAKLNTTSGGADPAWNPNATSAVGALALDGSGNIYAGGNFTTIGGQPRSHIAKLNTTNAIADAAWNPNANVGGHVYDLALDGSGNIYAGGLFTSIGGQARNKIAKLNTTNGNADPAWSADADGDVTALVFDVSNNLYVGGAFATIGGQTRSGFAAFATAPPTAPVGAVTVIPGNGQATVIFTAPASDGGSAITIYTATSSPGGLTGNCAGPAACAITVTGLSNGSAYTFTVTATNAAGTGAASAASASIIPSTFTAALPDTGQDTCYNDTTADGVAAANPASIARDAGSHPRQDCRFGRDAAAAAGVLTKTGAGAKGFDYTKIANNGTPLAAGAALGTNPGDWACTKDNTTGLTWEVKTSSGLRNGASTYTWYNSNPATNGGNAGTPNGGACSGGSGCDTEKFVADVNSATLCGYSDWRMPTRRELLTLVHAGVLGPSIDAGYFPNTAVSFFWSGSTYATDPTIAWAANFIVGTSGSGGKSFANYVRLVRGGQF